MVFLIREEVRCLQCRTVEPMTEAEALDAVREQNAETPGALRYDPCPASDGFHPTLAEARVPGRRLAPGTRHGLGRQCGRRD